jgi:hypothetical protein
VLGCRLPRLQASSASYEKTENTSDHDNNVKQTCGGYRWMGSAELAWSEAEGRYPALLGSFWKGGSTCVAILTCASEVCQADSTIHTLALGFAHMISVPTNAPCDADVFRCSSRCALSPRLHTMILPSQHDPTSIFADGKLKAGIYKIQNIAGHTYLDIRENTQELCCRPGTALEGKGFVSYPLAPVSR